MSNDSFNKLDAPQVNEDLLRSVNGGQMFPCVSSAGLICSISGECRCDGRSCWDILFG